MRSVIAKCEFMFQAAFLNEDWLPLAYGPLGITTLATSNEFMYMCRQKGACRPTFPIVGRNPCVHMLVSLIVILVFWYSRT